MIAIYNYTTLDGVVYLCAFGFSPESIDPGGNERFISGRDKPEGTRAPHAFREPVDSLRFTRGALIISMPECQMLIVFARLKHPFRFSDSRGVFGVDKRIAGKSKDRVIQKGDPGIG